MYPLNPQHPSGTRSSTRFDQNTDQPARSRCSQAGKRAHHTPGWLHEKATWSNSQASETHMLFVWVRYLHVSMTGDAWISIFLVFFHRDGSSGSENPSECNAWWPRYTRCVRYLQTTFVNPFDSSESRKVRVTAIGNTPGVYAGGCKLCV